MGWALSIGLCVSWLLLSVLGVGSMAIRYASSAAAIYFLGFVWGGWRYLLWWNSQARFPANFLDHATPQEELAYQQEVDEVRKKFKWMERWVDFGGLGDDPLSAVLGIFMLVVSVIALAVIVGYLPYLMTEALAAYLAEVVLEFVLGAMVLRHVLKPRAAHEYWRFMFKRTWLAGLLLIAIAAGLGWIIQDVNPEAKTLFQAFR
jgi:hypothetical protein